MECWSDGVLKCWALWELPPRDRGLEMPHDLAPLGA